ncbi:recombinase family protein [Bifidobacterium mongoliense]|jgi:DNA invertase Pin-like site-specific DNA recombinase|uniref:recombinase family protein n=1 Tax=Bifidobacterium mongoliense TaxID=518643 RepID=UPI00264742DD|nr:recombinase family protein [Bifidobacterium mongoliense]MCI1978247.1 recombinase family protein [Bifidobacteriaceae bacterium]MDN6024988.1 recombinase family protein [Bifidobacterium mongoliense]MDN6719794.1 recombinase family protein [Bifidobacterium mongoliense]
MRAVLYTCLASASPQEVEAERAACERIARAAGHEIGGYVHDQSPDRSGLVRLLDTAHREGIDALVVTSIDQLSLDPGRLQQLTEQLERAGVQIITPHPSLDYAYQRIRGALLTPWDSDGGRGKEEDADDHRDPGGD